MAPDELDRVFERFARTDRARQSGAAGLGLGLYACRGIVSAHGGTIVVTSDGYDRGTTVTVTLPTMDEEQDDARRVGTEKRDAPGGDVSSS